MRTASEAGDPALQRHWDRLTCPVTQANMVVTDDASAYFLVEFGGAILRRRHSARFDIALPLRAENNRYVVGGIATKSAPDVISFESISE